MPYYITQSFSDVRTCCKFSRSKKECRAAAEGITPDGPAPTPMTPFPTETPPDSIVEITAFGMLQIQNVDVPEFNAWSGPRSRTCSSGAYTP